MKITKVTAVYFSPNGKTKEIVNKLARALEMEEVHELDFTLVASRQEKRSFGPDELVVVGFPVYSDRLPVTSGEIFPLLKGNNTPAVAVVSYGNRAYGDALLELKNTLEGQGMKVVSGAAIIGEHCQNRTVASGRPDEKDDLNIQNYGHRIVSTLKAMEEVDTKKDLAISGAYPYAPLKKHLTPQGDDRCIQCGLCFEHCPVNAISEKDFRITDPNVCIFCAKCIQVCPTHARDMKEESYLAFMTKLEGMTKDRKEMEIFI